MFWYRAATEGLKPRPCLRQETPKLPTLFKTAPFILGPCIGQMTQNTICSGQTEKNYIPCLGQRGQKPYPVKRHIPE